MKTYSSLVCDALLELADGDFQLDVWTGQRPGTMSSFEECLESLFTDSGLALELERGEVYGAPVDQQLRDLDVMSRRVDTSSVPATLADPQLVCCRRQASIIGRELRRLGVCTDEPGAGSAHGIEETR